jgi:hypothetical protein
LLGTRNNDNNGNETNKNIINKDKRRLTIAGASAAIITIMAALLLQSSYTAAASTSTKPANSLQQQDMQEKNQEPIRRGPGPVELSAWGKETSSFEVAKTATGISGIASLPSSVPDGLKIASIRTNVSPIANFLGVFYTPAGVTANDNDTLERIMSAGGMLVIYSQEKVGPEYNQTKWIDSLISEGYGVRHLSTINGQSAILVDSDQADQIPSEVILIYNEDDSLKTMTDLVSLKYSSSQLAKTAESITNG